MKTPVLSRLTWAWLGSLALFAGLVGVFAYSSKSGEGVGRIALSVDRLEIFARNPTAAPGSEERITAPALRDDAKDTQQFAEGEEGEDGLVLIYPDENDLYAENEDDPFYDDDDPDQIYSADDVVITIAGGKRARPAVSASLTPAVRAIPDPDTALMRTTALGRTPRIASDGRRAVQYYARPYEGGRSKPRIALIVGGLGQTGLS